MTVVVLEAVAEEGKPVSEVIKGLSTRVRSGEINAHVTDIPGRLAALARRFADGELDEFDGITISYPAWWFNVRPSNIEPLLRLNVEADNRALMEQQRGEVLGVR